MFQKTVFLQRYKSLRDCLNDIRKTHGVMPNLTPEMRKQLQDELDQGFTECLADVSPFSHPIKELSQD